MGDQLWGTGDKGEGENRVTATLRLSSRGQKMYRYRGTIVSGSHIVWHRPSRTWREVAHCPEAEALGDYQRDTIYCLETTIHQFIISQSGDTDYTVYRDYQGISREHIVCVQVDNTSARLVVLSLQRGLNVSKQSAKFTRHVITSQGHLVIKDHDMKLGVINDYLEGNSPHLEKKTDSCILELLNRLF